MKIQKLTLLFSALILLSSEANFASDALLISDVGTSAKMLAVGQIEGFDDTAVAIFENPAALHHVEKQSVSLFTTTLFDEVHFRNVAYARKFSKGTLGIGYMSAGVDDIAHTSEEKGSDGATHNIVDSYFGVNHAMFKVGYEYPLSDHLYLGTTATYFQNSIGTVKGSGVNGDVGLMYIKGPVTFSGTLKNVLIGSDIKYSNNGGEPLPFQTVWGAQYHIGYFDFLGQYRTTTAFSKGFKSAGVHFNPGFMKFFHLRAGYKDIAHLDKISHHATFGIGLSLKSISFDYAYEKSDVVSFDNNNYFSISVGF